MELLAQVTLNELDVLVIDWVRNSGGAGDVGSFPVFEDVFALLHGGINLPCTSLELKMSLIG